MNEICICKTCGENKPRSEFSTHTYTKRPLGSCKKCRCDKSKRYRAEHQEERSAYEKRRWNENRDRFRRDKRERRQLHVETERFRDRQRYQRDKDKRLALNRKWRERNRQRFIEMARKYHADHRKQSNNRRKAAYHNNILAEREKRKNWRSDNRERLAALCREYYTVHKERLKANVKEWRRQHLPQVLAANQRRRAMLSGCPGKHTAKDVGDIWDKQGRKCAVPNCPHPIAASGKNKYHVDHIQPLSRGGSNWPENLQILCQIHNLQKHARDPYEWAGSVGFLFI